MIGLGKIAAEQGRIEEAESYFDQALKNAERFNKQFDIANAKENLALIYERKRDFKGALNMANEASEIYKKLGIKKIEEIETLIIKLENLNKQWVDHHNQDN